MPCAGTRETACPVCAEDPAQCAAKAQPPEPEETYIIGWTWVDEEEFLTEYDGEWYLSLPGAERDDLTEELLEEMLQRSFVWSCQMVKRNTCLLHGISPHCRIILRSIIVWMRR